MVNNVPPPPPPPPGGFRGGPGPGPGPQDHRPQQQQQQPHHQQQQPQPQPQPQYHPQQFQQPNHAVGFPPPSQLPIRIQSHKISNLQTQTPMDETACLRELTTYKAYTLQKLPPVNSREKATWARADVQEERLAHEDLIKAIDKLKPDKHNKHAKSVAEKKLALKPFQSTQVTNILDDLANRERDRNYEWTLTQMESKISKKNGALQTDAMTIYFKRAPVKGSNIMSLYQQHIDKQVHREREDKIKEQNRRQHEQQIREQAFRDQQAREQQLREMQHQAQQQQQQQQQQPNVAHPIIIPDNGGRSPNRLKERRHRSRVRRKSDRHSDSESDLYDSDSSYSTDFSSNETSISTSTNSRRTRKSDRYYRKDRHSGRKATRQHRKEYYNVDAPRSPRAVMQDRYVAVPEVTRPSIGLTQYDQVEAAYRAGLHRADTEHYALDRLNANRSLVARERQVVYEHVPRSMPPYREEAAYLPRAIAEDIHQPPLPPRIYSGGPRYVDVRQDPRDYVDDDRLHRQQREAHEHIENRRGEPHLGRRTTYYRRPPQYEPVIHQRHPFAPRSDRMY